MAAADPRKLGPIYEAIDVKDYRDAIKLIETATAKLATSLYTKYAPDNSLSKQIANVNGSLFDGLVTGRRKEGLATAALVQQSGATNMSLLNALLMVYKEANAGISRQIELSSVDG